MTSTKAAYDQKQLWAVLEDVHHTQEALRARIDRELDEWLDEHMKQREQLTSEERRNALFEATPIKHGNMFLYKHAPWSKIDALRRQFDAIEAYKCHILKLISHISHISQKLHS